MVILSYTAIDLLDKVIYISESKKAICSVFMNEKSKNNNTSRDDEYIY